MLYARRDQFQKSFSAKGDIPAIKPIHAYRRSGVRTIRRALNHNPQVFRLPAIKITHISYQITGYQCTLDNATHLRVPSAVNISVIYCEGAPRTARGPIARKTPQLRFAKLQSVVSRLDHSRGSFST